MVLARVLSRSALASGGDGPARVAADALGGRSTEGGDAGGTLVGRGVVLVGVALVAAGAVLDWHVVSGQLGDLLGAQGSVSGLDTDGDVALGVGVVGGGLALVLWDRAGPALAALTGLVAGGLALYHLLLPGRALGIRNAPIDFTQFLSPGVGLYVVLLGAGVLLVGAVVGVARA
jgi:hypothetical protein